MTESQAPRKTPVRQQLQERGLRGRPASPSLKPPLLSTHAQVARMSRLPVMHTHSAVTSPLFCGCGLGGSLPNQVLIPLPMTECAQTTQPVFLICPLFFSTSLSYFLSLIFFFYSLSPPPFPPLHSPPILSFYCNRGAGWVG